MTLTAADIPKENVFGIGRGAAPAQGGFRAAGIWFHFANPRRPFVFSRAEALNMIGHIIAHQDLQPEDIDKAVARTSDDPFSVASDGQRFMITGPQVPVFVFTLEEAMGLIGHLIRKGGIQPSEIDDAMIAIGEQARGQSIEDVTKLIV